MAGDTGGWSRWPLALLVAGYLALGLAYSLATPVGEAPDESSHVAYVQYLLAHRRLPRHGEVTGLVQAQAKHPPLYYALMAALTPWGRFDKLYYVANPHCCNLAGANPSPAELRHTADEQFPYTPPLRAVRVVRLWTLLLGLLAVGATWATARTAWPDRPAVAWGATAVVAFLPQFLFMQGAVNNDGLANPLGSLCLWAAIRVVVGEARRRDLVWLGLFLGLGLLTKLTLVAYLPLAALAAALVAWRRRSLRPVLRALGWTGGPVVLIAGWWFVRNARLYGDLLGWRAWEAEAGDILRHSPLAAEMGDYLALQWTSFWGRFGWLTLPLPDVLYRGLAVLTALATAGLLVAAGRRLVRRNGGPGATGCGGWGVGLVFVATAGLVYASVFRLAFTFDLTVGQGRYLFTGLSAFASLFVLGLLAWVPRRWEAAAAGATAAGMCLLAVYGLAGVLAPAFRLPPRLGAAELAAIRHPLVADFGPAIRLLGYDLDRPRARPGEAVEVSLYWTARSQPAAGCFLFLHLVDAAGEVVGRRDVLPWRGRYPTVSWLPDRAFRERFRVPVAERATAGQAFLLVGFYPDGRPGERLPVTVDGRAVGDHLRLERLVVAPTAPPAFNPSTGQARGDVLGSADADGTWRDRVRLEGFTTRRDPGGADAPAAVAVTLYWTALAPIPADYTVFVHLVDAGGLPLAFGDGPPQAGRYPTGLWAVGETVADEHRLDLPSDGAAEPVRLRVGLYLPASGERMAARRADGRPWPDGAITLED